MVVKTTILLLTTGNYNLTVTEGVVSNIDDSGIILTSAKVDYGNSGGLAVDKSNCMIGVPTWILSPEGSAQNLGALLSMPIIDEYAKQIE